MGVKPRSWPKRRMLRRRLGVWEPSGVLGTLLLRFLVSVLVVSFGLIVNRDEDELLVDSVSSAISCRLGDDGERRAKIDMERRMLPLLAPRGGEPLPGETIVGRGVGTQSGTRTKLSSEHMRFGTRGRAVAGGELRFSMISPCSPTGSATGSN